MCVHVYRAGKGVETGSHPTGRPTEGSAEKQHQFGKEARIWEVNTNTDGPTPRKRGLVFYALPFLH